ncbi:hypothetical protein NKH47_02360 [Mesorhizobium sp. M1060]|jgi:hypothetical protein|uniref:hypothetical protein n=2 Tax=unclassified Mesorhizobium TaxID=325217 RepID=UPI001FD90E3C|nr:MULTISPECIES: hypothetical protein [unclassified Mesorhizobium]WJI49411.1 hypothetical protein NLY44_22585 [Mesorhizobium sp. C089B]
MQLNKTGEEHMADGPTVVNSGGGGGTAIAVVLALIAVVVLLIFTGVINIRGDGGKDINVKVEAPKVEAPAAPAKPAAPAPAPASGG